MNKLFAVSVIVATALPTAACSSGDTVGDKFASSISCVDWDQVNKGTATVWISDWEDVECALNGLAASGFLTTDDAQNVVDEIKVLYAQGSTYSFTDHAGQVTVSGTVTDDMLMYIENLEIKLGE
jgi:hypothetical protein